MVCRGLDSSGFSAQTSVAVGGGVEERSVSVTSSPLRVPSPCWLDAAAQPIWHALLQQSWLKSPRSWKPYLARHRSARAQSMHLDAVSVPSRRAISKALKRCSRTSPLDLFFPRPLGPGPSPTSATPGQAQ